jgi:glutaconate CoA-transferase, subunit A
VAQICSLAEAVRENVHDGDTVAMEGFTHLIPHAAAHEMVRQRFRNLHLIRMTPDMAYDLLIGTGAATKVTFAWGGNPGVGSLQRFRDAVENGWPHALELDEHSHAGMSVRYVAGASGLPFGVLRGYVGTDLMTHSPSIKLIDCPFTGETLAAVPAINPDVTVIHAQQADEEGNVMIWGLVGVQKEAVLAARRSIVTVEEIVPKLEPRPGAVVLPSWVVSAVCHVPDGAHPSFAMGYSERDNAYYKAWDNVSKDRDAFLAWIDTHIHGTADFAEFRRSVGLPAFNRDGAHV